MHPSMTTSYLLPAIFFNPVLFLHTLNTILSRILPPIVAPSGIQPPPYSDLGPSAQHPHIDVHASENLCWIYTALMVCMQIVVFGKVVRCREERREKNRKEKFGLAKIKAGPDRNGKRAHEGKAS
ncbi:hypothetical protein MMC12_004674 [Toensbergia leucococca]|nr:hypothetical protein [Toensbergia leucococca]